MWGTRVRLFRLLGIPIKVDVSWLLILAIFTSTFMQRFAADPRIPGLATTSYFVLGLVTALLFFVCVVLHELGHAVVARATGMPIQGITLFLFGGVAELGGEPVSARDEFFMAIAGPVVSALLAAGCYALARLTQTADWSPQAVAILEALAMVNAIVLVFNLIPAFPLDGGRVFRSILWGITGNVRRATYWAALAGRAFAWFLIGLAILSFFSAATGTAASGLDAVVQGIWLGLIGMFLASAAQGSYQQVLIRQVLKGEPVRRFMNQEPIVVSPQLDLRRWVEDYVYRYHRKMFPVASDGRLEGIITTKALARFNKDDWDRHTVAEAMQGDLDAVSIGPDADALEALGRIQKTGSSRLLVTEGGRLVGIISLKDLLHFLRLKIELEEK